MSGTNITVVRRTASKKIHEAKACGAGILDVTSKGENPWLRFSPFYAHCGIPVPLSEGYTTASVEGAWQALKVFETADVDVRKMRITDMKGLKRTLRTYGRVLGHRAGIGSQQLLGYIEARKAIYLPLYKWVLENRLQYLVDQIRSLSQGREVVLLDYETNGDVDDRSSPLSHAALIKAYVQGAWPGEVR